MSQTRRTTSVLVSIFLLAPTVGLLLTPAALAEEGEDVRVLAVYRDFSLVRPDEFFAERGLVAGYRFASIPAVVLAGPSAAVEGLRSDFALAQLVYDDKLELHLETAVVSSKAVNVWGSAWHSASPYTPILKNGQPIDGRGVTVGIVDSGVNALHPDLWYAPAAVPGGPLTPKVKECVHTTNGAGLLPEYVTVPTPDCDENVGHGTHVAGIVAGAGTMADMGFTVSGAAEYNGAAPGASLVAAGLGVETLVLGGLIIDGLAGLDYMYRNADLFGIKIVTNSWSSTAYNCNNSPNAWNNDGDVFHAISNKMVQDKGITVLWASNNAGGTRPIGTSPQARNTMPGVIMVANYDDKGTGTRDGDIAASSGDGCVLNGAAGVQNLIWTWPDVAAPGTNIVSTAAGIDGVVGMAPIFVGSTPADAPFYTTLTGTSMATPHVAGVAALMYQAYPDITPAQVETILIKTAKPFLDAVATRNVSGSQTFWGSNVVNNAVAGFADPTLCRISPAIAARAEANDATLDALYPGFRSMVQPRLVNGQLVDVDANTYVCRDYKRGHGLIDAEAAVREALRLAGDDEEGLPEIRIDVPSPGAVIDEALMTVEGIVNRDGDAPNVPPTATLGASTTSGPAPLSVDFSLAGTDTDGTIAGFSLDFGDGSAPLSGSSIPVTTQPHTYTTDGTYDATLVVTDDEGAIGEATVKITVGGLPVPNRDVAGSMFAYNFIAETPSGSPANVPCPGVSNVVALGASTATSTDVPPMYPPGREVCRQARSVTSTDPAVPLSTASTGTVRFFDADGNLVGGPHATTAFAEVDAVGNPTGSFGFSAPRFEIPIDWSGRYYLAFAVDTPSGPVYIWDTTYDGLKPIDVIGPDMLGVPGLPGSDPGGDEGHSIGDADDDGLTPMGEIEWVDTSLDADWLTAVIKVGQVPPQPAGDSAFLYNVVANGVVLEAYILVGHNVWDNTNGQDAGDSTTTWDIATNTVTIKISRAYLASVGADCPCTGHVQAMLGEGQLGGIQVVDRAPDAGSRDLRASWQRLLPDARASSESDPENTDPEGDPVLGSPVPVPPHADVTKVWVSRETPTEIDLTLKVKDLSSAPPSVDAGNPFRASWNYGIDFCANNAGATYTATGGNYAGVSGVVCYRLSAADGELGVQHSGGGIQADGSGSCGITGLTKGVSFNTAASTVTWTVDLGLMTVRTISGGVADCTTTPQARDAPAPATGNVLSRFAGRTGFSGPVVTAIVDDSVAADSRTYTLGDTGVPLVANAGSDLSGLVAEAIPIAGSATGGTPPYSCLWSAAGGVFADANACSTSVTFDAPGLKTLTLTVTDDVGASAVDTASVEVLSDAVEHVQISVGGNVMATIPVTTGASQPTADWETTVDVTGLDGLTDIVATWYDADGTTVLATATRTVDIQLDTLVAFIDIVSPEEDTVVSGTSSVSGMVGHRSEGGGPAQPQSGLNHYGFPLWSGLTGARASVMLEGQVLNPCAACQPGQLQKPVQQVPNAAWNPVANNANPVLFNNLLTSSAWLTGPDGPSQGVDGWWFDIAGHGGDDFTLSDEFDVEMDIRFYNDWSDAQSAELGGVNGAQMPKSGSVPGSANWAFVYMRKPTAETVFNQFVGIPILELTPVIVPPSAVQGLAATPGPETVALTWSAPINDGGELLGYKVKRDGVLLNTVSTAGYVDTPGDTLDHVYAVTAYNSAGESGPVAVTAAAQPPVVTPLITSPLDGAVGVPATTTIDGTYTPTTGGGGGGGGSGAFANTHYVALMNLNSDCGGNLGYGDHVIFERLAKHAIDVLGMPANNVHVFNEMGGALSSSVDAANYARLSASWQRGDDFDGPARWSVFAPALRQIAATAAAGEAAGGAPARIFFLQSSHGLQASVVLGDGATDSIMCLVDADVSSTELGTLLNSIDSDVAAAHPDVSIEWSVNIDCSFCGGFADSPLPAPGTTPVYSAGVVGPNRVVEVGCAWVTECFGNPAVTYDYMFNECVFTNKADGYGPLVTTFPGSGTDGGDVGNEIIVGNPDHATPDGVITLEESYWCALETAHATINDPIATQQMFQISDNLAGDMFGLDGFPLWEADSSLDLGQQDPTEALDVSELHLPDVRVTDPSGDATTDFSDLTGVEAHATSTDVYVDVFVADLTISSLALEDVVQYEVHINDDRFAACYLMGEVFLWGDDIPSEDPVTGEPSTGAVSSGDAIYDTANGVIHFRIPRFELNDQTLPATVYAVSTLGDCNFDGLQEDDRAPDSGTILTSEDDDPPVTPGVDKITVVLSGPASITGDATLNAAAGTWTYDPPGDLANGVWTATATQYRNPGSGFVQHGSPAAIEFTVGAPTDVTPPTVPGTPTVTDATTNSISLAWTASTDNVGVDHYEVLRNGASVGTTTDTSFTDTGLAAGTTYSYVVKAFDAAGNSATSAARLASTQGTPPPVGTITLRVGTTLLGQTDVDLSGGDPAPWSVAVDWAQLPEGTITLVADYDDGAGGSASDSVRLQVAPVSDIEITSPQPGENVLPSFTVAGTVEGAGGPQGMDTSTYVRPGGTLDPLHGGVQLARTNTLQALHALLKDSPGYVGVSPALEGTPVIRAYFTGAAPAIPASAVPVGWTLETVEDVQFERALQVFEGELPLMRAREGPPAPAEAVGMGPGSHLLMRMRYAPGFTFACTANFVWQDQNGDYYLGAAGHCFLPNPIPGGPQDDRTATHGPGADYNPADTTVSVCVSNCQFGGQAGFLISGNMVTLGNPAYARQHGVGSNVGNDFGIVKIPRSMYDLVRPHMPVWNGPTGEGTLSTGEGALLYGNAGGFGEIWPTMARAGFGGVNQGANAWSAFLPSFQGDSGSALVSASLSAPADEVVEGGDAVGILTHLVLGTSGPVGGTTMARAKQMASEAGLTIRPVLQGETIAPPDPTPPGAPILNTLSPGTTTMGLSWSVPTTDGGSPITGYTIRYGTSAGSYTQTKTVGAVTSTTVTGLAPATQYHFVVAATNAVGTGVDSNERSATTQPLPTPPSAPLNLGAVPDNGKVILGWDAPSSDGGSPITSYIVSYTGGPSGTLSVGGNELGATVNGLINGREYTFTVAARNEAGTGDSSNEATATPNGPPPPDFRVEIRADAAGVEVIPWTVAAEFDGSSFSHDFQDVPSGDLTLTARLLQDGVEIRTSSVDVHVLSPPELTLPASVSGNEKQEVSFTATATDADGPAGLTFSLVSAPAGATIGAGSGVFRWTPDYDDAGIHVVTVRVTDPDGLSDTGDVELVIGAANRPPVLAPIGNKLIGEGELLAFTTTASDHENDPLTFAADGLPAGASYDTGTGEFSWTPAFGTEGNYEVTFSVSDGINPADSETVTISVGNVDRPPALDPVGDKIVAEAGTLAFLLSASDPDVGDVLTFGATGLPQGATLSTETGAFLWIPSYTQAGSYPVRFRVSDGELSDFEDVTIVVTNTDRAPSLDPIAPVSILQTATLNIPLRATDPDTDDTFTWSLNGPTGAVVTPTGPGRATLSWTPTLEQLGPYTLTIVARSGPDELIASRNVVITVLFKTDFTVFHESSSFVSGSPGEQITVTARVTNTGPQTDTFAFQLTMTALWKNAGLPTTLTLAPGESALVSTTVSVPYNQSFAFATIGATSLGDGTTHRSARFRIDVPVEVELIELGHLSNAIDVPRGTVLVTHLDGTPAVGALVTVTQMPPTLGGNFRSTASGATDENGHFRFDFSQDPRANTPGRHQLVIVAKKPGGLETNLVTHYQVGTNLV